MHFLYFQCKRDPGSHYFHAAVSIKGRAKELHTPRQDKAACLERSQRSRD